MASARRAGGEVMASSTPHVIVLQTNEEGAERPICEALATTTTIKPGHLLMFSSGKLVINDDDADTDAPKMFAVENPFYKATTTEAAIDHAYAADETVRYIWPQAGDILYAFIETASDVARGAALESDGAGGLQAWTAGRIIAFADEDKANATGSQARIRVRIA
jgi:hypothetical protein